MINLNKKRCFIILAVFTTLCIAGILVYGEFRSQINDKKMLQEINNLTAHIKECENKTNYEQCVINTRDLLFEKTKEFCKHEDFQARRCSQIATRLLEKLRPKIYEALDYYGIACEYGDLDSCYEIAMIFIQGKYVATNLQGAKNLLDKNCQKSHQQSCDKLKELK